MSKYGDLELTDNDIVIADGDISTVSDINAIGNIISTRIRSVLNKFCPTTGSFDKAHWIGKENTETTGVSIEEAFTIALNDITASYPNISLEIVSLPYDMYEIYIKIFIANELTGATIIYDYTYNLKDGAVNVHT